MTPPPTPADEAERLAALADLAVLDTAAEERFDRLTRLAARILGVPIALVSLVDSQRQWFKSRIGLDVSETPREHSFCGHAIGADDLFVVGDASVDARFHDNPLVLGDPEVRFYAGRPLHAVGGERVGTLCVIDRVPRTLSAEDRQSLEDLAALVERELQQQTLGDAWELNRSLQARYQAIFENLHEAVSLIRPGEGWILGNGASDRILGYPEGTTRLDNRPSFVHPDDEQVATQAFLDVAAGARRGDDPWLVRVRAADGSWRWFESNANDLRENPDVAAILVSTRDVTERMRLNEALSHAAGHDPLTDLANRGRFHEQLAEALARADRDGRSVSVCFVDLDRFKPINDEHGHLVGDEVLCSVADRLRRSIRAGDVAARLGGDEFVVLLEAANEVDAADATASRIAVDLGRPHPTSAGLLECGVSIGVARARPGDDVTALLGRADVALYQAKAAGRGRVVHAPE